MGQKKVLRGISDIRRFFHRNETPVFFISATNFNLLGMDEWCKNFKFINYIDCYDGRHPNTFVPNEAPHPQFNSIEDINNYLLQHKEVLDFVRAHGRNPKAVFLMFDEGDGAARQGGRAQGLVSAGAAAQPRGQQDQHGADRQPGRRAERAERARDGEEL